MIYIIAMKKLAKSLLIHMRTMAENGIVCYQAPNMIDHWLYVFHSKGVEEGNMLIDVMSIIT